MFGRKRIILAISALAVVLVFAFTQSALALTDGNYTYTLGGGNATITGYAGAGGAVTIPSTLGSPAAPVTAIGAGAFQNQTVLTSVAIPLGVTSIGDMAFRGCTNLTSIAIPASVVTMGQYAISQCWTLTGVTIPAGVTSIGYGTFSADYALTTVTIPAGVTSISSYAFYNCSHLTGAYFLGNAPSVANNAFANAASGFKVYYTFGRTGFVAPPGPWVPTGNPVQGSYTTAYDPPYTPVTSTPASSPWSLALAGIAAMTLMTAVGTRDVWERHRA
jgi:hypothetical protein